MIIEEELEGGCLRADMTGKFSLEEAKRTFLDLLDALALRRVNKVLLDGRGITGEPEVIERFFYGEFVADAVVELRRRGFLDPWFAYVLTPPVLDPRRLGETTAINRGVSVKAFDSMDPALKWLALAPAR